MTAPATANDYATLGLRPSASLEDVEEAFQRLALHHHPDRNDDPRAGDRFQAIAVAYERIRNSGNHRIYKVGETQPEDADDPLPTDFIPFEQAQWDTKPVPPTLWQQLRPWVIRAQALVALITLALAGNFYLIRSSTDRTLLNAFNGAPLCSVNAKADCVLPEGGQVVATTTRTESPWFGDFNEGIRMSVTIGQQTLDVGVGRPDSNVPYGGLVVGDTATALVWRGEPVGVQTADGTTLPTDFTPSVIASRHVTAAWAWVVVTLLLAIRPVLSLFRWGFRKR